MKYWPGPGQRTGQDEARGQVNAQHPPLGTCYQRVVKTVIGPPIRFRDTVIMHFFWAALYSAFHYKVFQLSGILFISIVKIRIDFSFRKVFQQSDMASGKCQHLENYSFEHVNDLLPGKQLFSSESSFLCISLQKIDFLNFPPQKGLLLSKRFIDFKRFFICHC